MAAHPGVKNGEVFGVWPPGSEPDSGIAVTHQDGSVRVEKVNADGAAKAGLMVGDVVQKANALPVATEDDLRRAIAQHDPGQEIVLDLIRNGAAAQVKLPLLPRVP